MKLSEKWLREWVNPTATAAEIAMKLNLAGLETEAEPLSADLPQGIVVGRIISVTPHPQADRLRVCEVDAGASSPFSIVCGAANARAGLLVPAALPGARLPGGKKIERASLRGVESAGMLCSASELGLSEKSEGLLELDFDATPGVPLVEYLALEDQLLNLELTPNRGDCLSIAGLAREVAALYGLARTPVSIEPANVISSAVREVVVEDPVACPHYAGRLINGLNPQSRTPDWMRERLRRSGIRSIHPVVDITNYVMLELGQPMHGFDAAQLSGAVRVRRARVGETLRLLNDQTIELRGDDLLIADDNGPLVLAGVMGGQASGVSATTTSIFLESACFDAVSIATSGRRYKLLSDSRYRNERGVDPALQRKALERATALVLQICGGEAGRVTESGTAPAHAATLRLRNTRITQLLGTEVPAAKIAELLTGLGVTMTTEAPGVWQVQVPTWRYDLRIEADLVEEIGRLYGYENIPARAYKAELPTLRASETKRTPNVVKDRLIARGYQEIVTYSFVDPKLQTDLDIRDGNDHVIALDNPIAETMSVMRTTLWSGLIATWQYNRQRQIPRARLFEFGVCFQRDEAQVTHETARFAGLLAGSAMPEQWGQPARLSDFYDAKSDIEALLPATADIFRFEPAVHRALHPGQTAQIFLGAEAVGWIGTLHPRLVQQMDIGGTPILFEIDWSPLCAVRLPSPSPVPELPHSRRDLSLEVGESVTADSLLAAVRQFGGPLLRAASIFDIYRGPGLSPHHKSVTLGLIFQDYSRTLSVEDVDAAVGEITAGVAEKLGASVRSR